MNGCYHMAGNLEVSAQLRANVQRVCERIQHACDAAKRPHDSVQLLPITKYVDVEVTRLLHEILQGPMGESRPQIVWEKAAALPNVQWHLVGHLQRNKVSRTLPLVSLIHSVDSQRLLTAIEEEAKKLGIVVDVLLELHLTLEATKNGFGRDEWDRLPEYVASLQHVRVQGLMTMAAMKGTLMEARGTFEELRSHRDAWQSRFASPHELRHLSMGMTNDLEEAIAAGSTIVRVGSALFEGVI
jgi:pyridoxal phosphate enzyme (YggS family)